MYKRLLRVLLAALLIGAFIACGDDDDGTSAEASSENGGQEDEPIVIGAILSETGAFAQTGAPGVKALKAFEEAGYEALGRKIEFEIINDQSNPTEAAAAAQRLTEDDGVVAILGPSVAATMQAAFPIIKAAEIPAIFTTSLPYPNYNQEPYIFSMSLPSLPVQAKVYVDVMSQLADNQVIMAGDDASGKAMVDFWAKPFGLPSEVTPASVTDYTPIMSKLKSAGHNGLIVGNSGQGAVLARQAQKAVGLEAEMMVISSIFGSAFIQGAGDAANGVRGFTQASYLDPEVIEDPETREVVEAFQTAFEEAGGDPGTRLQASWAWDAALSIQNAIERAGSTDPEAVQKALESQDFIGTQGPIKRAVGEHTGVGPENMLPAIIENGEIVLATDVEGPSAGGS